MGGNKGAVKVSALISHLQAEGKHRWDVTVHVPGESISELLTLDLHVQADRDQNFSLSGVFVDHRWIVVVKAAQHKDKINLHVV